MRLRPQASPVAEVAIEARGAPHTLAATRVTLGSNGHHRHQSAHQQRAARLTHSRKHLSRTRTHSKCEASPAAVGQRDAKRVSPTPTVSSPLVPCMRRSAQREQLSRNGSRHADPALVGLAPGTDRAAQLGRGVRDNKEVSLNGDTEPNGDAKADNRRAGALFRAHTGAAISAEKSWLFRCVIFVVGLAAGGHRREDTEVALREHGRGRGTRDGAHGSDGGLEGADGLQQGKGNDGGGLHDLFDWLPTQARGHVRAMVKARVGQRAQGVARCAQLHAITEKTGAATTCSNG